MIIYTDICFKCQGTSSDGDKLNEECDMLNTISEGERSIFKRKTVLEHKLICIVDIFVIRQPLSMQQT